MTDNELFASFIPILSPLIQTKFGDTVSLIQKDQPTQQGTPSDPTVFFEKLFDKRYGWESDVYTMTADPLDPTTNDVPNTSTQVIETTIQFSALCIQDPNNPDGYTAADMVRYVAMLLGNGVIIQQLRAKGVNVQRSTQVRNPPFVDDRERFEFHPSFDIVMQHQDDLSLVVPKINAYEYRIYPV